MEGDWDPLADPADLAAPVLVDGGGAGAAGSGAGSAARQGPRADPPEPTPSSPEYTPWGEPSLAALTGPLGRDVVLESSRMADIEAWIAKAEEAGLAEEEITPARRRRVQLGQGSRAACWQEEERLARERQEADRLRAQEKRAAAARLQESLAGGSAESLKSAIMRAYHAGLDDKTLIDARHKLMGLEGRVPPPTPKPKLKKEDLAKEMLQAMKAKDLVALRLVLDTAVEGGVKLPGLQAARAKLEEWEKARPKKAAAKPAAEPRPGPQAADAGATGRPLPAATEAQPAPAARESKLRLRVVLPDGRKGWLEIGPQESGAEVLKHLLPLRDRAGSVFKDLRFFWGEAAGEGAVRCREEMELDKPLYAQGCGAGTHLCIQSGGSSEEPAADSGNGMAQHRYDAAMARATQAGGRVRQAHQQRMMDARGLQAAAPATQQVVDEALDPSSSLWRNAMKAVCEPFPPFSMVDHLLGGGRLGESVVVGWNAAGDPDVRKRSGEAYEAVSACHLVLTGDVRPPSGAPTEAHESFLAVDVDGHFGSLETEALVAHIGRVAGVAPPFLLTFVSRGYLSRRLAAALRRYLPEGVPLFASPPFDVRRACCEEVHRFGARIFEEARRLHCTGAELRPESVQALDRLRPAWREHPDSEGQPEL